MHILCAVPLVLALGPFLSWVIHQPQDTRAIDAYVPLKTYETFESLPPEDTLHTLSTALNTKPAELYFLSIFYAYDTLPASEKAALKAERELNKTIDDEIKLCLWTIPGTCFPLLTNGHRREIKGGWVALRRARRIMINAWRLWPEGRRL